LSFQSWGQCSSCSLLGYSVHAVCASVSPMCGDVRRLGSRAHGFCDTKSRVPHHSGITCRRELHLVRSRLAKRWGQLEEFAALTVYPSRVNLVAYISRTNVSSSMRSTLPLLAPIGPHSIRSKVTNRVAVVLGCFGVIATAWSTTPESLLYRDTVPTHHVRCTVPNVVYSADMFHDRK